jgi:hypothetical protein
VLETLWLQSRREPSYLYPHWRQKKDGERERVRGHVTKCHPLGLQARVKRQGLHNRCPYYNPRNVSTLLRKVTPRVRVITIHG